MLDIKDIEIRVGEKQKNLPIEIWVNKPNRVKLSIVSPSGEVIDNLESKNRKTGLKEKLENLLYLNENKGKKKV